jgi:anaerobic magnesium-protoporphyrin IX monomethyl ester cyclase
MGVESNPEVFGLKEPGQRPDLVLINSPINDYNRIPRPDTEELPAFGLAYIATESERAGFNVGLLDAETLALSPEETAKIINNTNPKWVGINMLTPTYQLARRIVVNIKPEIPLIAGAAHAKALPEKVLRDPLIGDRIKVIALEDGEYIVRGLLQDVDPEDMEGVAYIDDRGEFVSKRHDFQGKWIPRELDNLHIPDRKFLPGDPFMSQGKMETNMVGSRGCPFDCSFCAGAREMMMFGVRNRSVDNIMNEVKTVHDHGIKSIRFIDDLFLANKKRANEFFQAKIDSGTSDVVWDSTGRANILSKLDEGTLVSMAQSGCREVAIGIESSSQRMLNLMNKGVTPDMVKQSVVNLSSVGIRVKGYFILGYPSETEDEMRETVKFMHDLRDIARKTVNENPINPRGEKNLGQFRGSMFEFRPYPGTPLYEFITGKKPWPEGYWDDYKTALVFTEDEILTSFRPVFMEGLEERQKHNYTTDHPFTEVRPYQVQEMIVEAMTEQRRDMIERGEYLPGLRSSGVVYDRETESQ